ncbi:winged helix-turn-helix transcriptional regulator [Bacillus sp. DNRA2]|uniref:winged helix-turn-helix domain-containing protein n=1 Tax=Bacillus sp. DNRA2 TaxID=2723053 RepID=UPI00145F4AB1|nr:winged helix-turn-helix transcriptional regulator [Bacillus sp. DNRA2]NMD72803.1 winged helix-turn-helix transcriptional regulator [Bacillus sp. DNRA2]
MENAEKIFLQEPINIRQIDKLDAVDQEKIQLIRNYLQVHKPIKVDAKKFIKKVFEGTDYFVCLFNKNPDTVFNELFGVRKEVYRVIDRYENKKDKYISYSSYVSKKSKDQNGDKKKVRTIENIRHTVCLVQDLDYYKFGISESGALATISELVDARELEMPHILLFTGKGIQLIWLIDNVYMKRDSKSHRVWTAVQESMMDVLKDLNPDSVVKNPAAVTRLPNTINSKNGQQVRAYLLREDRLPLGYFIENYLPFPEPDVRPARKVGKVVRSPKMWNEFTLNRERENDVFRIVEYKQSHNENLIGIRQHLALVLRFHALVSSEGDYEYAENQVHHLWAIMKQREHTSLDEILRRSQAAERYYQEYKGEVKWTGDGKYQCPGLFYKNTTLVKKWEIPVECQIQLKTIKVKNKEYDRVRKNAERRNKGIVAREDYLEQQNDKKADKLWQLQKALERYPNATQRELAEYLGWSVGTVNNYMKRIK